MTSEGIHDYQIKKSKNGKPFIKNNSRVNYNISHCNHIWLCVFRDRYPVGIDIEENTYKDIFINIARRFFHENEFMYIKQNKDIFPLVWTAKESFVKCTGRGIDNQFNKFSVISDNGIIDNLDNHYFYYFFYNNFVISICTLFPDNDITINVLDDSKMGELSGLLIPAKTSIFQDN